jgi:hypothetical protein
MGLQGCRVPALNDQGTNVCAGRSYADFNAYDTGLYVESSDSSSDSQISILQPVPSLPGLSEPLSAQHAARNSALKLAKQQGPGTSSGSSTLSPTKHQAWRQVHVPRPVGKICCMLSCFTTAVADVLHSCTLVR